MAEERSALLASAAEHIDAEFGVPRVEHGVVKLERRLARRRATRRGLTAVAASSLLVLGLWLGRGGLSSKQPMQLADALRVDTQDGSEARGLDSASALSLERDAPDEVSLALVRGKGHFEVKPNKKRRYHVRAGDVEVEVLGTAFVVERLSAAIDDQVDRGERPRQRARVHVEHGVVKVSWPGGTTTLRAGEQGVFPPAPGPTAAEPAPPPERVATAPEPEAEAPANAPEPGERWRSLARAGKHKEAFHSIGRRSIDDLSGLLLAADAARSFARAYELDRDGPLAEDALAREAEAYHRAGDGERAERAAERYLERYPKGARRAELLRYTRSGAAAKP